MALSKVRAVPSPVESKLKSSYRSAYFVDAFAVTIPSQKYTAHQVTLAFVDKQPLWFTSLLWIRDIVVSMFGVQKSSEIKAKARNTGTETIGFFPVVSKDDEEVIIGEDDSHLDFRTSILIRDCEPASMLEPSQEVVATTVVHTHGLFGKIYINFIRIFHVAIVKYSLARVPSRLMKRN